MPTLSRIAFLLPIVPTADTDSTCLSEISPVNPNVQVIRSQNRL